MRQIHDRNKQQLKFEKLKVKYLTRIFHEQKIQTDRRKRVYDNPKEEKGKCGSGSSIDAVFIDPLYHYG